MQTKNQQPYQLPPAQDIYDFDSEQLQKIRTIITKLLEQNSRLSPDWIENAQKIKSLVDLELEQRAEVQNFGNMCIKYASSPDKVDYLQKFDDFNRQFQILVNEAVKKNESEASVMTKKQQKPKIQFPPIQSKTVTTQNIEKFSNLTNQSQFSSRKTQKSNYIGLPNKKKKNQMNEMMLKLLARTKVQDNKVSIGRSAVATQKQIKYSNETPVIQNKLQNKEKIVEQKKTEQKDAIQQRLKKKDEIVKQMKNKLVKKDQQTKTNDKKLLEYIKKQQELKTTKKLNIQKNSTATTQNNLIIDSKKTAVTQQPQKKQINNSKTLSTQLVQNYNKVELCSGQQTENVSNSNSTNIIQQQIIQKQEVLEDTKQIKPSLKLQNIKSNKDLYNDVRKQANQYIEINQKNKKSLPGHLFLENQQFTHGNKENQTQNNQIVQQMNSEKKQSVQKPEFRIKSIKYGSVQTINKDSNNQFSTNEKLSQKNQQLIQQQIKTQEDESNQPKRIVSELKKRIIRTPVINKQMVQSEKQILNNNLKQQFKFENLKFQKRISESSDDQVNIVVNELPEKIKSHKKQGQNQKSCYSEEYWNNVRQEAISNLEKMKKLKYERELQKQILNDQTNKALNDVDLEMNKNLQSQVIIQKQENKLQTEIQQPSSQNLIKKPIKLPVKKQAKKPIIKKIQTFPQKPLPDFIQNYLEIYPTFNHIFSPIYIKPFNEAILDTNSLMKQLINLFTLHKEIMNSKDIYKKPMFSSFDHYNTMYLNDPRQLLLHAQTTHIDLKILIDRLNIFNENLHGRFEDNPKQNLYYRVVKSRQQVYDIITTSFLRTKNWRELPHGQNLKFSWNLLWSWSKPQIDLSKLIVFQKINHFPLNKNMSRKDLLYKNIDNLRRNLKIPVNFLPITFNLPKEFTPFSIKFHEDQMLEGQNNIWIMKPIGKSRGRGIKLVNNIADLNYIDNIVVQKYLKNPLLLDGYKFDMRIYVLVTSIHPLQAFVYREGFARLSTEKFSIDPQFIKNTFIHLTNFAIQKNNLDADNFNSIGGSKISLKTLQEQLQKKGIKWKIIWQKVHEIIIKSLLACSLSMPNYPSAFELFGYDIMIDQNLNCYLIQINASPSLERSYLIDEIIKQSLIDDIIKIVDPINFDRQQSINVFKQRLNRKTPPTLKQDNIDIGRMVGFKKIRKIGQLPSSMGLFERVVPEKKSQQLQRLVNSKYNPNMRLIDN